MTVQSDTSNRCADTTVTLRKSDDVGEGQYAMLPGGLSTVILAATDAAPETLSQQLFLAGLVAGPLTSALVWYVKKSETRLELERAADRERIQAERERADRWEGRYSEFSERALTAILQSAKTLDAVAVFLQQVEREGRLDGSR